MHTCVHFMETFINIQLSNLLSGGFDAAWFRIIYLIFFLFSMEILPPKKEFALSKCRGKEKKTLELKPWC